MLFRSGVKRAARRSDPRSRIEHIRVRNVSVKSRLGEFRTRELNRSALHGKFIHLNRVDNLTSDGSLEACLSLANSEACAGKLPRQITLVEFGENLARSHQISRLHKHVAYATRIPEIEISFLGSDDPTAQCAPWPISCTTSPRPSPTCTRTRSSILSSLSFRTPADESAPRPRSWEPCAPQP